MQNRIRNTKTNTNEIQLVYGSVIGTKENL